MSTPGVRRLSDLICYPTRGTNPGPKDSEPRKASSIGAQGELREPANIDIAALAYMPCIAVSIYVRWERPIGLEWPGKVLLLK